ncbi:hypothetical protein H6G18_01990 [Anabaena subtropica FACHB-260]|uniref:Uncharacterized protein n=1 Tax=Anabaena subtropica FACHB-260 TaxID=2692884 RepID=A0ABR8CKJ3_9NOST|nr:hypothetical protein [Anabaena subtropica]MBD2342918.1 hypothetical protein [Anabaena subtropica FACHB-260]
MQLNKISLSLVATASLIIPAFFGQAANATEDTFVNNSNDEQAQVTNISQLSDVQPTDWAFPALQSLVER